MPLKLKHPVILDSAWLYMAASARASLVYYSQNHYTNKSENPILNNPQVELAYVENFELQGFIGGNAMTTPFATGWNGATVGATSWGVQEDYSAMDPDGGLGFVWSDSGGTPEGQKLPSGIHFDFTPDTNGRLPEYAGAALLGKQTPFGGSEFNLILVYDSNGMEVTSGQWQIAKPVFDPLPPIEDLFLNFEGIYVPGGISRILFRDFTEVDHLTYGYTIPEPSAAALAAGTGFLLLRRRRAAVSSRSRFSNQAQLMRPACTPRF